MSKKNYDKTKIDSLAQEILLLSRNTLLVNMRFLDAALSQFEYVADDEFDYMTDGKHLFYNANHVLLTYSAEREIPVRDYLHMVLHCVFRHMYCAINLNRSIWDLACDIAVEYIITGLDFDAARAKREQAQLKIYEELEKKVGKLTAERLYRYYIDESDKKIRETQAIFSSDAHDFWYWSVSRVEEFYNSVGVVVKNDNQNVSSNKEEQGYSRDYSEQAMTWKDISERIMMEISSFSKLQGNVAGRFIQQLREINREKYDYKSFLKKFAVRGEVMQINDEEFDYIFYTFGLKQYGNMPLIEPIENKEVKRIKEFVIAIDTSGSVEGDEVQAFIEKTYNILKSTESFFGKINIHIIQCDAEIQEHVKITNQEEFDEYIKDMTIKGLGGTDFRPVFSIVDRLIQEKEFSNLKGLIYFTDGYGIFPNYKPNYDVAFIFIDDEDTNIQVPVWAIKLVLHKEEI